MKEMKKVNHIVSLTIAMIKRGKIKMNVVMKIFLVFKLIKLPTQNTIKALVFMSEMREVPLI
jgi:hypothetical protein